MPSNHLPTPHAFIRKAVIDTLAPAGIEDVQVREGRDHEGNPALLVNIIVASTNERLDAEKMLQLHENVRQALQQHGHDAERVPIFTFLTPEDLQDATT